MASDSGRRIGSNWTLVAHDADTVEFRTGVWNTRTLTIRDETASGKLWQLVRLIKDGHGRKEIADRTGARVGQVDDLLDRLTDLGIVSEGPRSVLDNYLLDAISLGEDYTQPTSRIVITGDVVAERAADALTASLPDRQIELRADGFLDNDGDQSVWENSLARQAQAEQHHWLADALVIVATATNNPGRFRYVDTIAATAGFRWMHATIDGPFLFVGPTVIPGQSACYADFETRVAMNLRERESYLKYKAALADGRVIAAKPDVLPPLAGLLGCHVALEALNLVTCGTNSTVNKVLAIYLPTMELAYHEVLPLPTGPDGPYANRDSVALYFDSREWLHDSRLAQP
jgi:bacteriocin biosynthesis cyclodehydratase domain-containing protein